MKTSLPLISLLFVGLGIIAQSSFAANNACPPKPASSANGDCPNCAIKANTNTPAGVEQLESTVDALSCEPWAVTRSFDAANQCPKLFFDEIFKDRVAAFIKSPKAQCPIEGSSNLPDAESLEAILATNPVTNLGLPPGAVTNPKCLYKNYRGQNLDTIFGRFIPKQTATEQERMTGLAEYYYHMNKIKYGEQGLLAQMAGIDSILGGPILPDKNCADPNNPFSEKWCASYHANGCGGPGRVSEVSAALKTKYNKMLQIQEEISHIAAPSQPEQKEQIQALRKQITSTVGADVILLSPKFQEVARQSGGDISAALRAQLQENRADLARQLAGFQDASRCINSSKSVSCPALEKTVNKVSDDFLPEMLGKGGDQDKTSLAETYMDRVSCLQEARGSKETTLKNQGHIALMAGSFFIGAGEAAAVDVTAVKAFKAAEVAWGLATAAPIARDAFKTCVEASHRLDGAIVSQDDPYQLPSCSKNVNPSGLLAVHNYTACYLGIGEATVTALLPTFAGTKGGRWAMRGGKAIATQGGGLLKQVFVFSVGSSLINSFFGVGFNIVNQQSSKLGTQALAQPAQALSNWISQPNSQTKRAAKHAMNQLSSSLDPSRFAGLKPAEANKLFQDSAGRAYKILLNSQQVLRGDQLSGVSMKLNQRINPLSYYANIEIADTEYMVARADLEKVGAPKTTDDKQRISQDKVKMQYAETIIARNIAGKMLYDFMTPQYRADNGGLDPKLSSGLDIITQANQMGFLTKLVRTDIQELLGMDGWSPDQVQKVIDAQANGQSQDAEF